jgi:hypothetical protein
MIVSKVRQTKMLTFFENTLITISKVKVRGDILNTNIQSKGTNYENQKKERAY